jgi:hypothetical protein
MATSIVRSCEIDSYEMEMAYLLRRRSIVSVRLTYKDALFTLPRCSFFRFF